VTGIALAATHLQKAVAIQHLEKAANTLSAASPVPWLQANVRETSATKAVLDVRLIGSDELALEFAKNDNELDAEVLAWLHEHTAPGEKIEFASGSPANLQFMRRWGLLRRGWRPDEPGRYRWRVIQRRPPFYSDCDRRLVEHAAPAWIKTIRPPNWGFGPWRLDVPLIEVFACDEQPAFNQRSPWQPSRRVSMIRASVPVAFTAPRRGRSAYRRAALRARLTLATSWPSGDDTPRKSPRSDFKA
jgi:hypothetical protein